MSGESLSPNWLSEELKSVEGLPGPGEWESRVHELEALNAQLRDRVDESEAREAARRAAVVCPWDDMDDERSSIPVTQPCPVCGMLGTPDAEDRCVGGPRRLPRPTAPVTTGTGEEV